MWSICKKTQLRTEYKISHTSLGIVLTHGQVILRRYNSNSWLQTFGLTLSTEGPLRLAKRLSRPSLTIETSPCLALSYLAGVEAIDVYAVFAKVRDL